jgi:hypothetical protein
MEFIYIKLQGSSFAEFQGLDQAAKFVFFTLIITPIIFGIIGFLAPKEHKIRQGFTWLLISAVTIWALTFILGGIMKFSKNENNTDNVPAIPLNSPERKMPIPK